MSLYELQEWLGHAVPVLLTATVVHHSSGSEKGLNAIAGICAWTTDAAGNLGATTSHQFR